MAGITISASTLAASGAIFDNFVYEISIEFYPDTAEMTGLTLDDFYSEVSITFEPDTAQAITGIPIPTIPPTGVIAAELLALSAVIELPLLANSALALPENLGLSTSIPFPVIERGEEVQREVSGGSAGFALMASCTITVHRPEEVKRLIRNLHTVYINTDEYRLFNGRPVDVPKWDLPVPVLVSSMGHFLTDRETPEAVTTGADIRWIAGTDYWDTTFNRWIPTDDGLATRYWWETSEGYSPTVHNSYTYYLNKEEITRACVHFDEDDSSHMWSVFDQKTSTSESLVIMMVVALNPIQPYQDRYGILDSGGDPQYVVEGQDESWYPQQALVNRTACWIKPHQLSMRLGSTTTKTPQDRRPSFNEVGILTMNFNRDGFYAQWYADEDKWKFFKTAVKQLEGNSNYVSHNLVLGRTNGSLAYTANMNVFDINLWTRNPTIEELVEARKQLKSVYGIA